MSWNRYIYKSQYHPPLRGHSFLKWFLREPTKNPQYIVSIGTEGLDVVHNTMYHPLDEAGNIYYFSLQGLTLKKPSKPFKLVRISLLQTTRLTLIWLCILLWESDYEKLGLWEHIVLCTFFRLYKQTYHFPGRHKTKFLINQLIQHVILYQYSLHVQSLYDMMLVPSTVVFIFLIPQQVARTIRVSLWLPS